MSLSASAALTNGTSGPSPGLTRAQIAGVAAGNGLEFYDFLTYAFFSAQIGRSLFPTAGGHSLLFSLATFGAGFTTRPLGGLILGRLADRRGRKPAMLFTFACMGIALVGLALTPSYARIGAAAPVLAVLCRLLQGFAIGGEVGTNTAFLLEAAPANRRGLYVSCQYMTQDAAVLACGLVGYGLSCWLSPAQLDAWGWRLALLLGASIIPFGLLMRRSLGETLQPAEPPHPTPAGRRTTVLITLAGLLMLAAGTIGTYTLDYLTTYAQNTLGMAVTTAFGATVVLGATSIATDLVVGQLVDRYGSKRVLLLPWILLILLAVPSFLIIAHYRSATSLLAMGALMSILLQGLTVPSLILFTTALPAHIRAGSLGIVYALSIAVFGGSAQFIDQSLIGWTRSPIAPAWYMTAALLIGSLGVWLIRETKPPSRSRRLVF